LYKEFKHFVKDRKGKIHGEMSSAIEEAIKQYIGFNDSSVKKTHLRKWSMKLKINNPLVTTKNMDSYQAHHLFPKSLFPELALEEWNGALVDKKLHNKYHSKIFHTKQHNYTYDWVGGFVDFITKELSSKRCGNANLDYWDVDQGVTYSE
jgi:hypothetical protein